jgi:hypothetical protein
MLLRRDREKVMEDSKRRERHHNHLFLGAKKVCSQQILTIYFNSDNSHDGSEEPTIKE